MNFINVSEPKKMNPQIKYIDLVHLQYTYSNCTILAFFLVTIPLSISGDDQEKNRYYEPHLFLA